MSYSIDISCFLSEIEECGYNNFIKELSKKYDDCEWYVCDIGPYGKNIQAYKSHGFKIGSLETLKNVIKDVKNSSKLWIAFCAKGIENNDCIHIYYSNISLSFLMPQFIDNYNTMRETFVGTDKEIYDLCSD